MLKKKKMILKVIIIEWANDEMSNVSLKGNTT